MVITGLEEKENRKFYVPIRPGNRGGWSLFQWDSVRQMPYKQRQLYLGGSTVLGVLDKGGKWRKKDWYLKGDKKYKSSDHQNEFHEAIKKDQERMNAALGKQIEDEEAVQFTPSQMRQMLKKIKKKGEQFIEPEDKMNGLGYDKIKVQIRAKPSINTHNPHRLQGIQQQQDQKQKRKESKEKKHKKHKKSQKKQRSRQKKQKRNHRSYSTQKRRKHKQKKKRVESDSDD